MLMTAEDNTIVVTIVNDGILYSEWARAGMCTHAIYTWMHNIYNSTYKLYIHAPIHVCMPNSTLLAENSSWQLAWINLNTISFRNERNGMKEYNLYREKIGYYFYEEVRNKRWWQRYWFTIKTPTREWLIQVLTLAVVETGRWEKRYTHWHRHSAQCKLYAIAAWI